MKGYWIAILLALAAVTWLIAPWWQALACTVLATAVLAMGTLETRWWYLLPLSAGALAAGYLSSQPWRYHWYHVWLMPALWSAIWLVTCAVTVTVRHFRKGRS